MDRGPAVGADQCIDYQFGMISPDGGEKSATGRAARARPPHVRLGVKGQRLLIARDLRTNSQRHIAGRVAGRQRC